MYKPRRERTQGQGLEIKKELICLAYIYVYYVYVYIFINAYIDIYTYIHICSGEPLGEEDGPWGGKLRVESYGYNKKELLRDSPHMHIDMYIHILDR